MLLTVYSNILIEFERSLPETWLFVKDSSQEELWIFLNHPEDSINTLEMVISMVTPILCLALWRFSTSNVSLQALGIL